MKHSLFLLLILFCVSQIHAQKILKSPLRAISADSVMLWDLGETNWRSISMRVNKGYIPKSFEVKKEDYKTLKRTKVIGTLTGGFSPLFNVEEGYQATLNMRECVKRFLLTGEGALLNVAERALFNALPYATSRSDLSIFDQNKAAASLYDAVGAIYATTEHSVYVNFYLNSFVRLQLDTLRLTLDQITNMPYLSGVKFRVGGLPKGLHRFVLRLRLPEWTSAEETSLSVNGHEYELQIEKGFIVIDREWRNHDEAYLEFPLTPRIMKGTQRERILAVGPLLFIPRKKGEEPFPQLETLKLSDDEEMTPCFKANGWEFIPLLKVKIPLSVSYLE